MLLEDTNQFYLDLFTCTFPKLYVNKQSYFETPKFPPLVNSRNAGRKQNGLDFSYMASFKKTVKFNTLFTTWTPRGGNKRPKPQVVPADSPDVQTPIIKNQPLNVEDHQQNKDTEETPV